MGIQNPLFHATRFEYSPSRMKIIVLCYKRLFHYLFVYTLVVFYGMMSHIINLVCLYCIVDWCV